VLYLRSYITLLRIREAGSEKIKKAIEDALAMCKNDMFNEKAALFNSLYSYYYTNKNFEKAAELAVEAVQLCLLAKSKLNATINQGNLAAIYINFRKGNLADTTLNEILNGYIEPVVLSPILNSKARNYHNNFFELDKSINYYVQCIVAAQLAQRDHYLFGLTSYPDALVQVGLFDDAYKVVQNFNDYIDSKKLLTESVFGVSQEICWFYLSIGDFEMAAVAIDKILEIQPSNERFTTTHNKFLNIVNFVKEIRFDNENCGKTTQCVNSRVEEILAAKGEGPDTISRALDFLFWIYRYKGLDIVNESLTHVLKLSDNLGYISLYMQSKLLYAKSLQQKDEEKLSTLKRAYLLSPKKRMTLIFSLICNDISLCYEKLNENLSKYYAAKSCEEIRKLLHNSPRKFWSSVVSHYNLWKPFKKIIQNDKAALCDINTNLEHHLEKMMDKGLFDEPLFVEKIKTFGREALLEDLPSIIRNPHDLLCNLTSNAQENLRIFAKYFASISCAYKYFITIEDVSGEFLIVASNDDNFKDIDGKEETLKYLPILYKAKTQKRNIFASKDSN